MKKNISASVDSFFKLLIIFVSNADLEIKSKVDSNDPNETDYEDFEDIKNNVDMTHEKFVNEILVHAKKLYFKQKSFSWSEHFDYCNSFTELQKILAEKNVNIPELQQNKLKDKNKLGKNIIDKNKKIKNKDVKKEDIKKEDIKKIEGKNKIQIEINSTGNNKNKIDQPKKFDLKIKTIHNMNPDEKFENISLKLNNKFKNMESNELNKEQNDEKDNTINVKTNTNNEGESKAKSTNSINNITSLTNNQNDDTLQTTQKIGGIPVINNSKRENITDQHPETTFIPTTKTLYFKLIAKIVLYALAVIALAVFIFSAIKVFWFLAILSILLCLAFTFVAHKIKYKITIEGPRNIDSGYKIPGREEAREFTEPNKNQIPETTKYATNETNKDNSSIFPGQN